MENVRNEYHAPIPLHELRKRVSPKTYQWLQEYDEKEAKYLETINETMGARSIFHKLDEQEYENIRVREWCSSSLNADGVGGYHHSCQDDDAQVEDSALRVKYILSDAGGGHGDDLWPASRHISNMFANVEKCKELLSSLLPLATRTDQSDINDLHPLCGRKVIELGAGAGLPSWTALHCGAQVICTDQAIPNRVRSLTESAERNFRILEQNNKSALYTSMVSVCPYDWGTSIKDITELIQNSFDGQDNMEEHLFDVVIAADCIYMPNFHSVLLASIMMLMSKTGVALLPFALHGNVQDEHVWSIVDLAKKNGLLAKVFEPTQLTPQADCMDMKRALVYTIMLTWK
jgi:predicted nicotinamide N-methyase